MKILFVSREMGSDLRYGMAKSTLPIILQLQQQGHEVRYLCQDSIEPPISDCLLVKLLNLIATKSDCPWIWHAITERFRMGALAQQLAVAENYTHVHCHDPIIAFAYCLFYLFRPVWYKKKAWGFSEHGFGAYTKDKPYIVIPPIIKFFLKQLEKISACTANWVIIPSQTGLQQLSVDLNIKNIPPSWQVIPHARPDINTYSRHDARLRLGWLDDLFYIVAVGQLIPLKQFPLLIKACGMIKNQAKIQLVILGEGDQTLLQQVAQQENLCNPLIVTHTDDIGLYLSSADIYVSSSATESFGMANLEAVVAGLPVIYTDVGATSEIMGKSAIVVKQDPSDIAIAIEKMYDNPGYREAVALACKERGQHWPDSETISLRYGQAFQLIKVDHAAL